MPGHALVVRAWEMFGLLCEVASVGLVLDHFVDEVVVGDGLTQQVVSGCVLVVGGAVWW